MFEIEVPDKVEWIIEQLVLAGYEAYAVGGCVRDSILGRRPEDWDITTSAAPGEIKKLFPRTVDTGIQHGTVTVLINSEGFEVTTYRIDGEYEDKRHPKEVTFTFELREDLMRRDFTINAMAYSKKTGIVDEFGGMEDLRTGLIRCVGDPRKRFEEDALRMLRAVRFSAQLGFDIEEETGRAIRLMAGNMTAISAERIQTELVKVMKAAYPARWYQAYEFGITGVILSYYHRWASGDECRHKALLTAIEEARADKYLRLALLLHMYKTKEAVLGILKDLRFDNETVQIVSRLVVLQEYDFSPKGAPVRRAVHVIGEDLFILWLEFKRSLFFMERILTGKDPREHLDAIRVLYEGIVDRRECVSLKGLRISGKDLISLGIKPGECMGQILEQLLYEVLEEPDKNVEEYLSKRALEIYNIK